MEEFVNPITEYNDGYYSCEADRPFDPKQSELWKDGYHDKEKERLIRSVKYHLERMSGKIDCCHYMMNNSDEYRCYYYGKLGKCYEEMFKDFLRLYASEN